MQTKIQHPLTQIFFNYPLPLLKTLPFISNSSFSLKTVVTLMKNVCWWDMKNKIQSPLTLKNCRFLNWLHNVPLGQYDTHSNHVTSSKRADTLICFATICRNYINFLYNQGHVSLWCLEVVPVANVREGSMQEQDWARVNMTLPVHVKLVLSSLSDSCQHVRQGGVWPS